MEARRPPRGRGRLNPGIGPGPCRDGARLRSWRELPTVRCCLGWARRRPGRTRTRLTPKHVFRYAGFERVGYGWAPRTLKVKVYVASSWRNAYQPAVVATLRDHGHEAYDFRNPKPSDRGFNWSQVDPEWQSWSLVDYVQALRHGRVEEAFHHDRDALEWCDCCVLVLPAGASAHLEAGWCAGRGKPVLVCAPELRVPELMYKLFDTEGPAIFGDVDGLLTGLGRVASRGTRIR